VRAVNLIPGEQFGASGAPAGRSGGVAYAVLVLLGGLALLAFLYGHARRQIASRQTQVATINAKVQKAQAEAAQLAPYTNFVALREERERAVSQLVDARFDWAHSFHELGRVLPGSASITSIDGSVGGSGASASASAKVAGGAPTSATPAGSVPTITVSGCATSQAEVALTLTRLRLMDGVNEVTLQNSTKASSGASASAVGQCPSHAAVFSAVLTFAPLPAGGSTSGTSVLPVSSGGAR
jgi:Tfp pilus assembly protein PilN